MKAKALVRRLSKNIQNTIIDKHTLDYQPFLKITPKHQIWSAHLPPLFFGAGEIGVHGQLKQKSHSNADIPKKQLKKYIYLKFKKHNILQKMKESSSEENWGGEHK